MIAFSYSTPNLENPFENLNKQNLEATSYFDQNSFFGQNTNFNSLKLAKLNDIKVQNYYIFQTLNSLSAIKILPSQIEIKLKFY